MTNESTMNRVTEAQLRWAQFHFRRQAADVKESVEHLWMTPVRVDQVEEAQSEDGNTTEESATIVEARKRPKPKISRGRRALLRVSQRKCLQRRREIERYGYRCPREGETYRGDAESDEDDGLALIFAEESFLKKRKRRQKRRLVGAESERVRRFEAAFHSMMMSLAASQPQQREEIVATRVWTRPEGLENEFSAVDFAALKWGAAGMKRDHVRNPNLLSALPMDRGASWLVHLPSKPRRMMQQPSRVARGGDNDDEDEEEFEYEYDHTPDESARAPSPVKRTFTDIVDILQQRISSENQGLDEELESPALPKVKLSKYFQTAQLDDVREEKKEDMAAKDLQALFEAAGGSYRTVQQRKRRLDPNVIAPASFVNAVLEQLDADLVCELEQAEPGITRRVLQGLLEDADLDELDPEEAIAKAQEHLRAFARRYLFQTKLSPIAGGTDGDSTGLVKRFVAQMERAAEKEQLVAADGKLHKPTFARLVKKYLCEVKGASPLLSRLNASVPKRSAGKLADRYMESFPADEVDGNGAQSVDAVTMGIINTFIANMEKASEENPFVDSVGRINGPVFEEMVARYLSEASGVTETELRSSVDPLEAHKAADRIEDGSTEERRSLDEIVCKLDSEIINELESAEPGITRNLLDLFFEEIDVSDMEEAVVVDAARKHLEVFAKRFLLDEVCSPRQFAKYVPGTDWAPLIRRNGSDEAVQRFIVALESTATKEALIDDDGRLHRPILAQLVEEYLWNSSKSELIRDQINESASDIRRETRRKHFVDGLVSEIERACENDSLAGTAEHLDVPRVESLVSRYIADFAASRPVDESSAHFEPTSSRSKPHEALQSFLSALEAAETRGKLIQQNGEFQRQVLGKLVETYLWSMSKAATGRNVAVERDSEQERRRFVEQVVAEIERGCAADTQSSTARPLDVQLIGRLAAKALGIGDTAATVKETGEDSPPIPAEARSQVRFAVSRDFVKGFVEQIERAVELEPLFSDDGSVVKPALDKVLHRYVEQAAPRTERSFMLDVRSPVALARARQSARKSLKSELPSKAYAPSLLESPTKVTRFVSLLEDEAAKALLVSSEGKFDKLAFEALVDRTLKQVALEVERPTLVPSARTALIREPIATDNKSIAESDELERKTIEDPNAETPVKGSRSRSATAGGDPGARAQESASGRIGDFMKMFYSRPETDADELDAVAAFKRTQDERRGGADDTSSLSSFRVLPDGIKKVVQGFRRTSLAQNEEDAFTHDLESRPESVSEATSHDEYSSFSGSRSNFGSELSPERLRDLNHKVMEQSGLLGSGGANRSIIDTDGSDTSRDGMDPGILSNLLLSPTILTKRHQQAIRAVESRNWEQVAYLLSANPWLVEMEDVNTGQYLLHKLALFGAGDHEQPPAPDTINTDLVRMFPASIQKFDQDGNLPLHMAAASANQSMIKLLGDRFPGGASVRNEDGMLPLHLAILAAASGEVDTKDPAVIVRQLLQYFPGAVAVADGEGNLPIHTAASVLRGDGGVDTVYLLLDEAERQLKDPAGARFRNKVNIKDLDNLSLSTETVESVIDFDDSLHCNLVRNEMGQTPLMRAVVSRAGRKMIEALVNSNSARESILCRDTESNTVLHLLVGSRCKDAASILTVLKVAPDAACARNLNGMLPIEIACMQKLPQEVILALALVDLPFDLDDSECTVRKGGYGASWFFLTCECDDHYVDIVEEIIGLCSYRQARELCFFDNRSGEPLLVRATTKCRAVLQRTLRFMGRYEFVGSVPLEDSDEVGFNPTYRLFDAIDYGSQAQPHPEGRRVVLKCYVAHDAFEEETRLMRECNFDQSLVEEVIEFAVGQDGMPASGGAVQHCLSIEQPNLTLEGVVGGMLKNEDCQTEPDVRRRYADKVFSVLRVIAKALRHLHELGVVHGGLSQRVCGKYHDKWKVGGLLGARRFGEEFSSTRVPACWPPEAATDEGAEGSDFYFLAHPSADTWAFGKLAFEVLVGESLALCAGHGASDEVDWESLDIDSVHDKLLNASVSETGADLVLHCLALHPDERPTMAEALKHPIWKELKRQYASRKAQDQAV